MGNPTKQTTGIIKTLGELNQARGRDSTGLAMITSNQAKIYKDAVKAEEFFKEQSAVELLCQYRKNDFLTILGHTRAASRGAVNSQNAHPFKEGNIFFTHNGVIHNFDDLMDQYKIHREVDSEIIGYLLDKKKVFLDAFKELRGYFTVPYVDVNQIDTLKVAVHNNVFSYAIRGNQLYYSSDIDHLTRALKDHSGFTITSGHTDKQYSFYPFNNTIAVSEDKIETKPYVQSYYYNDHGYSNYTGRSGTTESIKKTLSDDMRQYLTDIKQATKPFTKKGRKQLAEEEAYERWFDRQMEKEEEEFLKRKYGNKHLRPDQIVIDMTSKDTKQITAKTGSSTPLTITTTGGIKHTARKYCKSCKRTHQDLVGKDLATIFKPKETVKTIFKSTNRHVVFN